MLPLRGIIRSFQLLADGPRHRLSGDALLLKHVMGRRAHGVASMRSFHRVNVGYLTKQDRMAWSAAYSGSGRHIPVPHSDPRKIVRWNPRVSARRSRTIAEDHVKQFRRNHINEPLSSFDLAREDTVYRVRLNGKFFRFWLDVLYRMDSLCCGAADRAELIVVI
jgi:hypothetical protein